MSHGSAERAITLTAMIAIVWSTSAPAVGQTTADMRTPDGQPDIQGCG